MYWADRNVGAAPIWGSARLRMKSIDFMKAAGDIRDEAFSIQLLQ
jgi:hypothetical protein